MFGDDAAIIVLDGFLFDDADILCEPKRPANSARGGAGIHLEFHRFPSASRDGHLGAFDDAELIGLLGRYSGAGPRLAAGHSWRGKPDAGVEELEFGTGGAGRLPSSGDHSVGADVEVFQAGGDPIVGELKNGEQRVASFRSLGAQADSFAN